MALMSIFFFFFCWGGGGGVETSKGDVNPKVYMKCATCFGCQNLNFMINSALFDIKLKLHFVYCSRLSKWRR